MSFTNASIPVDLGTPRAEAVSSASATVATPVTGGSATVGVPMAYMAAVVPVEFPHDPEFGPIDGISGALLATTFLACGTVRWVLHEQAYRRDRFRFQRSLDERDEGR